MSSQFNPLHIRQDFPFLKRQAPLIYFDSAATSQKPQAVIDALTHFYTCQYGTVHRAVYDLAAESTALYSSARESARRFLNAASADEIIFTKGTTEAINLVASSFGRTFLNEGDGILISETEHHSNIVPWQMICKERKALLHVIPVNDQGELILEEYEKLLSRRIKLVSIAHIANATGVEHPLKTVIALAHRQGIPVFVDGAQSASHKPVDVQDLDADFFAFSGHKAYGPTGIGVLYGKKEWLEAMPPYQGGGDMVETVSFAHTVYQQPPLKFEAGTPPIAEVIALQHALSYLESIGLQRIAEWEQSLLDYATAKLLAIPGLKIIGTSSRKGAIISFVVEGVHPLDIGTLLNVKGIAVRTGTLCAQPTMQRFGVPGVTRLSFALYNTPQEIDLFMTALQSVLCHLR